VDASFASRGSAAVGFDSLLTETHAGNQRIRISRWYRADVYVVAAEPQSRVHLAAIAVLADARGSLHRARSSSGGRAEGPETVRGRRSGHDHSSPGSRGGRANEAGSLHRAGVAAYLAVYGLAGRGVEAAGYAENGPSPVALSFETGDAVDDVRCDMSDRTVLRLLAKRKCGNDKHLASTVAQWARQLPSLGPGDRVGLAAAEPLGPVRHLAAAWSGVAGLSGARSRLTSRMRW
jgi:hypothetical protein